MSDFDLNTNLGAGERIYLGDVREFSWDGYQRQKSSGEKAAQPPSIIVASAATEPKTKRPAGRKKLDEQGLTRRELKAEKRRLRKAEERLEREQAREARHQQEEERKAAAQTRAKEAAARKEAHQRTMNRIANGQDELVIKKLPAAEFTPVTHAAACAPPIPGKFPIRIDHKTVFYVAHGTDIDMAIANYKLKHGL